jgi:hypothetical protein
MEKLNDNTRDAPDGPPSLLTKLARRVATRLALEKRKRKRSELLTNLPDEVRADVQRMFVLMSKYMHDLADD